MKFKVNFVCVHGQAIFMDSEQLGLAGLDRIRTGIWKDTPTEKVQNDIMGLYREQVTVTIPEKIARESGYFQYQNSISVHITERFLNQFVYRETRTTADPDTGEIQSLYVSMVIGESQIIQSWRDSGYPKNWI